MDADPVTRKHGLRRRALSVVGGVPRCARGGKATLCGRAIGCQLRYSTFQAFEMGRIARVPHAKPRTAIRQAELCARQRITPRQSWTDQPRPGGRQRTRLPLDVPPHRSV